jgi:hypothetical protein
MTNESILEACPHWIKLRHLDLRGIKSVIIVFSLRKNKKINDLIINR